MQIAHSRFPMPVSACPSSDGDTVPQKSTLNRQAVREAKAQLADKSISLNPSVLPSYGWEIVRQIVALDRPSLDFFFFGVVINGDPQPASNPVLAFHGCDGLWRQKLPSR